MTRHHPSADRRQPDAFHVFGALLDVADAAPEWITLFPKLGKITTRDGRPLDVDADALIASFAADKLQIPLDINHATETAAQRGERSDAVGWITELAVRDGALMGRVEWLDEGRSIVLARKYRYTSPAVFADAAGKTVWIKSVALVTAPALADQPTLHAASSSQSEVSMKTITAALGLKDDAAEAECLSAVEALKASVATLVPKPVHDKVVQQLAAATSELDTLKAASRKAKVDALLEGALKAKKIVPAEREAFEKLCASDDGLAHVETLFAQKAPQLEASGLDRKKPETGQQTPVQLSEAAEKLMAEAAAAGRTLSIAAAMQQVVHGA